MKIPRFPWHHEPGAGGRISGTGKCGDRGNRKGVLNKANYEKLLDKQKVGSVESVVQVVMN